PVYLVDMKAPAGTSADAAAIAAAHTALVSLFPTQAATFDDLYAKQLADLRDTQGKTDGINLGQSVANAILAARSNDGSGTTVNYTPGSGPGVWVPTPPSNAPALDPQWPNVTPFGIASGSQFRPPAAPALTSVTYSRDLNEIQAIGAADSTTRTAEQTKIANFRADGGGDGRAR